MASTSETGYAMTVGNYENLINQCKGYGAAYNPGKDSLKLDNLVTHLAEAKAALQGVKVAKTNYDNATNKREIEFTELKKFASRVGNSLAATDASDQTLDDARASINKILGKRATVTKKETAAEGDSVTKGSSTSQQSYERLADHFAQLVQTVISEPSYKANEPELTPEGLETKLQLVRKLNTDVSVAANDFSNARIARDKALFEPNTGVNDTAQGVKAYVKALFGPTSPQFKQVSGIKIS